MNAREFFDLVVDLREAQKSYFHIRSSSELARAKKLEKKVDEEIKRVKNIMSEMRKPKQIKLFGNEEK